MSMRLIVAPLQGTTSSMSMIREPTTSSMRQYVAAACGGILHLVARTNDHVPYIVSMRHGDAPPTPK
jgi:hypothetical protein